MPFETVFTPTSNACQDLTETLSPKDVLELRLTLQIIRIGRVCAGTADPRPERYMLEVSDVSRSIQVTILSSLDHLVNEGKLRVKTIFVTRKMIKSSDITSPISHPFTIQQIHEDEIMQCSVLLGSPTPLFAPYKHVVPSFATPNPVPYKWQPSLNSRRNPSAVVTGKLLKCMYFDPETGYARDPAHTESPTCHFVHPIDGDLWMQAHVNLRHEAVYRETGLVGLPNRSAVQKARSRYDSIDSGWKGRKPSFSRQQLSATAPTWAAPTPWGSASPSKVVDTWASSPMTTDPWGTTEPVDPWAALSIANPPPSPPPSNPWPAMSLTVTDFPIQDSVGLSWNNPSIPYELTAPISEVSELMEHAGHSASLLKPEADLMDVDDYPEDMELPPQKNNPDDSNPQTNDSEPQNPDYTIAVSRVKLQVQGYQTLQNIQRLTQDINIITTSEDFAKTVDPSKVATMQKRRTNLAQELERIVANIGTNADLLWLSTKPNPPPLIHKSESSIFRSITSATHNLRSELENLRLHRISSPFPSSSTHHATQLPEQPSANILGKRKAPEPVGVPIKRHRQRLVRGLRGLQDTVTDIQDRVFSTKNDLEAFSDNLNGHIEAEIRKFTYEADEATRLARERYQTKLDRARKVNSNSRSEVDQVQELGKTLDSGMGNARTTFEKMKERLVKLDKARPTVIHAATALAQSRQPVYLNPSASPSTPFTLDRLVDEVILELESKSEFSTKAAASLERIEHTAQERLNEVKKHVLLQLYPTIDIHRWLLGWIEHKSKMPCN